MSTFCATATSAPLMSVLNRFGSHRFQATQATPDHIKVGHQSSGERSITYSRLFHRDKRLGGQICTFYVIENPTPLEDRIEKGIITAYDDCYAFFI